MRREQYTKFCSQDDASLSLKATEFRTPCHCIGCQKTQMNFAVSRNNIHLANIKQDMTHRFLLSLAIVFLMCSCSAQQEKTISLFNGKNLKGWHADVPAMDTMKQPRPSFVVRNGLLVSLGKPEGHLITDILYSNYRLTAEYRFAGEPGNCGVLVHASTPRAL